MGQYREAGKPGMVGTGTGTGTGMCNRTSHTAQAKYIIAHLEAMSEF